MVLSLLRQVSTSSAMFYFDINRYVFIWLGVTKHVLWPARGSISWRPICHRNTFWYSTLEPQSYGSTHLRIVLLVENPGTSPIPLEPTSRFSTTRSMNRSLPFNVRRDASFFDTHQLHHRHHMSAERPLYACMRQSLC